MAITGIAKNLAKEAVESVSQSATKNISRGLRSAFKNAAPDVIEQKAGLIASKLGEESLEQIAGNKSLFKNMIRQDGERLTKFGDDINGFVNSASSAKGWIGGTDTRQINFSNMADAVGKDDLARQAKYAQFKGAAQGRENARQSADVFRKKQLVEKNRVIEDMRTSGYGGSASGIRSDMEEKMAAGVSLEDYSAKQRKYASFKGAAQEREAARKSADVGKKSLLRDKNRTMEDLRVGDPNISAAEAREGIEGYYGSSPGNESNFIRKAKVADRVYENKAYRSVGKNFTEDTPSFNDMVKEEKARIKLETIQARKNTSTTSPAPSGAINSPGGVVDDAIKSAPKPNVSSDKRVDDYMTQRFNKNFDSFSSAYDNGQVMDAKAAATYAKQFRMNDDQAAEFAKIAGDKNKATSYVKNRSKDYVGSAGSIDKALAYQVPQKAATVVGGAWLVNNMSKSKGEQSNSQLYGQSTPYR